MRRAGSTPLGGAVGEGGVVQVVGDDADRDPHVGAGRAERAEVRPGGGRGAVAELADGPGLLERGQEAGGGHLGAARLQPAGLEQGRGGRARRDVDGRPQVEGDAAVAERGRGVGGRDDVTRVRRRSLTGAVGEEQVGEAPLGQRLLHRAEHLQPEALAHRTDHVDHLRVEPAGDDDGAGEPLRRDPPDELHAVDAGHVEVADDDIGRRPAREQVEGGAPVGGFEHVADAELAQEHHGDAALEVVVLDHEDREVVEATRRLVRDGRSGGRRSGRRSEHRGGLLRRLDAELVGQHGAAVLVGPHGAGPVAGRTEQPDAELVRPFVERLEQHEPLGGGGRCARLAGRGQGPGLDLEGPAGDRRQLAPDPVGPLALVVGEEGQRGQAGRGAGPLGGGRGGPLGEQRSGGGQAVPGLVEVDGDVVGQPELVAPPAGGEHGGRVEPAVGEVPAHLGEHAAQGGLPGVGETGRPQRVGELVVAHQAAVLGGQVGEDQLDAPAPRARSHPRRPGPATRSAVPAPPFAAVSHRTERFARFARALRRRCGPLRTVAPRAVRELEGVTEARWGVHRWSKRSGRPGTDDLAAFLGPARPVDRAPRVLGLFAHPDDEVFCVGGTIARCADAGAVTGVVSLTHGETGQIRDAAVSTRGTLGRVRFKELQASASALGVDHVECLDLGDGRLTARSTAVHDAVRGAIEDFEPDVVVTFGPDGGFGHPDHVASCLATQDVVGAMDAPPRLLHARFPRRGDQMAEIIVGWLAEQPDRFHGNLEFAHALKLFADGTNSLGVTADHVRTEWFPPGSFIIEQGEAATELVCILSGDADVAYESCDGQLKKVLLRGSRHLRRRGGPGLGPAAHRQRDRPGHRDLPRAAPGTGRARQPGGGTWSTRRRRRRTRNPARPRRSRPTTASSST